MKPVKIADFGITEEFGYLPAHAPAQALSAGNEDWDQFGRDIPKLLMGRNFRSRVKALPAFNISKLIGEADIQRAMLILSYVGQSYQWSENSPATVMPANLAIPWYQVGKLVGRPPILSYQSYAADNWRRFDASAPIECGNIGLLQCFLGGQRVTDQVSAIVRIRSFAPGATVSVTVELPNGSGVKTYTVKLGKAPSNG